MDSTKMTSSIILELTTDSKPYYFKAIGFYNAKNLLVSKDGQTDIKLISGQFPPEYNFFNTDRLYTFETFSGHIFSAKVYRIKNCLLPEKMCQITIHCSSKDKNLLFPDIPINSEYIEILPNPNEGGARIRKHHTRSRKHKSRRARLTRRRKSIQKH